MQRMNKFDLKHYWLNHFIELVFVSIPLDFSLKGAWGFWSLN